MGVRRLTTSAWVHCGATLGMLVLVCLSVACRSLRSTAPAPTGDPTIRYDYASGLAPASSWTLTIAATGQAVLRRQVRGTPPAAAAFPWRTDSFAVDAQTLARLQTQLDAANVPQLQQRLRGAAPYVDASASLTYRGVTLRLPPSLDDAPVALQPALQLLTQLRDQHSPP